MRALVYHGSHDLTIEERSEPIPGEGELRVRVAATGLCGSDVHVIAVGALPQRPSHVLGHEFGGTLDDGRFVVVNPMVGCGQCAACRRGSTQICQKRRVIGYSVNGAFAEQIVVPRRNVVDAEGLTPLQAALVEPLATALHAYNKAGRPTSDIALIGAGAIGMCLLHVLQDRGVRGVVAVDPVPARQAHALRAGVERAAARLEGQLFETIFDAAGTASTRRDALASLARGGSAMLLGMHDDDMTFAATEFIKNDCSLIGCGAYTEAEFSEAIDLVRSLNPPWAEMVPLDEAPYAVKQILAGTAPAHRTKTVFQIGC